MIFGNSKFEINQVFYFWYLYSNDLCMLKAAKITQRFSIPHLKILTLSFLIWRSGGRTKHCKRKKHNAQVFPATLLRDPHDFCFFGGGRGFQFLWVSDLFEERHPKKKMHGESWRDAPFIYFGFSGSGDAGQAPVLRRSCSASLMLSIGSTPLEKMELM